MKLLYRPATHVTPSSPFNGDDTLRLSLGPICSKLADTGNVRLGGQGPIFGKPEVADKGKVRLGGQGPIFRKLGASDSIVDSGKVRLGGQGPIFR